MANVARLRRSEGGQMQTNIIELGRQGGMRDRIRSAKWAFTTRRVAADQAQTLVQTGAVPRVGDLVLAKVRRIGQHTRLELTNGRKAKLSRGDEIVAVFGNRYAPDQFEAIIPEVMGECHLVASGGVVSRVTFKHEAVKSATVINAVGLLADAEGRILNLADHALAPALNLGRERPPVIAVVGSSMNSGKTTIAAHLVRGLTLGGFAVNAGKVTGTGAGGDFWLMEDAGARRVLDFGDAGYPSTYRLSPAAVKQVFVTLLDHLNQAGTDAIVIEVADGLLQTETADLVASDLFAHFVDGVLFAAGDALGALYGLQRLAEWGLRVFAVSGLITRSPLAVRELLDHTEVPVLRPAVLNSPTVEAYIDGWLRDSAHALLRSGGRA